MEMLELDPKKPPIDELRTETPELEKNIAEVLRAK